MRNVGPLLGAYQRADGLLVAEEARCRGAGDAASAAKMREYRSLADQAYFVLLFAQLEVAINETVAAAIRQREGNPDWHRRRAWDTFAAMDVRRILFEDRVALVCDRKGPDFGTIMQHYAIRNRIAHGGIHTGSLVIAEIARTFQALAAGLHA